MKEYNKQVIFLIVWGRGGGMSIFLLIFIFHHEYQYSVFCFLELRLGEVVAADQHCAAVTAGAPQHLM